MIGNLLQPDDVTAKEPSQSSQFGTNLKEDYIVSPNLMRILNVGEQREKDPSEEEFSSALNNLRNSMDNSEPIASGPSQGAQTENDLRTMLEFLLKSNDLEASDIIALKQKVSSIQAREKDRSAKIL